MSVIRINKTKDYTILSNYHLKDKNLSLKAKGLLSVMLSLPENWNYTVEGLIAINKDNETSINSTLKELKQCGYLIVKKLMPNETKTGRIEYIYDIYETPKQEGKKQDLEFLGVEFLGVENQGQLNTNNKLLNNKLLNNIDEETNKEIKILSEEEKMFEEFWNLYPKKIAKQQCLTAYKRIPKLKQEHLKIIEAVKKFTQSEQWNKSNGQFIPNPLTFIHQSRWNDIYTINNSSAVEEFLNGR